MAFRYLLLEDGELEKALKRLDRKHVRYWRECSVREVPYNRKGYQKFHVKGNKPWSEPHQVVWLRLDDKQTMKEQHARVSCSCRSWRYMGSDWNAQKEDYILFGARSNGQVPDVRDPGRRNKVCKHVIAVLESLNVKWG